MRCILEGLLETVGLEITIVSVRARAGAHSKSWRKECQILGVAVLKLLMPNNCKQREDWCLTT